MNLTRREGVGTHEPDSSGDEVSAGHTSVAVLSFVDYRPSSDVGDIHLRLDSRLSDILVSIYHNPSIPPGVNV